MADVTPGFAIAKAIARCVSLTPISLLLWRRSRPVAVYLAAVAAATGWAALGQVYGAALVAESLQAIRRASKDGLRELRSILNVLRQVDDDQPTAGLPQRPSPKGPAPG